VSQCEAIPLDGTFYDPLSSSRAFECLISLSVYEKNLQGSYNTNSSKLAKCNVNYACYQA